jgi:hypothetical protein
MAEVIRQPIAVFERAAEADDPRLTRIEKSLTAR